MNLWFVGEQSSQDETYSEAQKSNNINWNGEKGRFWEEFGKIKTNKWINSYLKQPKLILILSEDQGQITFQENRELSNLKKKGNKY